MLKTNKYKKLPKMISNLAFVLGVVVDEMQVQNRLVWGQTVDQSKSVQ